MKLKVLGCSGGIGRSQQHTTALLLDEDILIDAGTGVAALDLAQLGCIDHVFLTHAHLDHIAFLPLMLDAVGELRERPVTVHATVDTQAILRTHIFNGKIWPDFSEIPTREQPYLRFETVCVGQAVVLDGRCVTPLAAAHAVPAVGYQLDSGSASLAFTGDTGPCDGLWAALNRIDNLRYLIIETAFPNAQSELASLSRHLCPDSLGAGLRTLRSPAEVFITHLKPLHAELIMAEIAELAEVANSGGDGWAARMLQTNQIFEF